MAKVSIIIPSRNEKWLAKTVDDIFAKAIGDIEVIVVADGLSSYEFPKEKPNLRIISKKKVEGLLPGINDAVDIATGKYIMKCDAHCMFPEGFDEILKKDCDDDWVVTARRFTLDTNTWKTLPKSAVDYFYLGCPWVMPDYFIMKDRHWLNKARKKIGVLIDDQMTIHGSIWFMTLEHFKERVGKFDMRFGNFVGEPHDVALKTWLGGGRVIINKKTWYAHACSARGKRFHLSDVEDVEERKKETYYWVQNKWDKRIHDFDWLIDKFWPLPNWPNNWREYYEKGLRK